jgi:hypothetical protein
VLVAVAVLALAAVVVWAVRKLRGGFTESEPGSASAWAGPRPAHPCVADAAPRASTPAPQPSDAPGIVVVALRQDVGARLYVGDTTRHACLGVAVRTGAADLWVVYRADSTGGAFTRAPGATPSSAAEAVRAIVTRR